MIDIEEINKQHLMNEDDPLIPLWRHRREISDRFQTVGELTSYLQQFDSIEDALKRVRAKIAEKERQECKNLAK